METTLRISLTRPTDVHALVERGHLICALAFPSKRLGKRTVCVPGHVPIHSDFRCYAPLDASLASVRNESSGRVTWPARNVLTCGKSRHIIEASRGIRRKADFLTRD